MFIGFKCFLPLNYIYLILDIFPINKYVLSILYKLRFKLISNTTNNVR